MREGYLGTEGCLPTPLGARIRITNGQFAVEWAVRGIKEVGGFALIRRVKEETIEFVKTTNVVREGECELRQLRGAAAGGGSN